MPFGQPLAALVAHQFAVEKIWRRQIQGAIQQNLARGADEQIRSAHHLGDLHRRVVHGARKLIRRHVVVPPHNEIAKIFSSDKLLPAAISVRERNGFAVRHTKTPGEADCRLGVAG